MSPRGTGLALLVVALLAAGCTAAGLPGNQFEMCVTSRRRVADLSNQNLTSFPLNLPDTTEYLDVSHNPIQSISADAFPWLPLLCFLKATHCGLRVISPSVFRHTPALQVLDISSNELTIIPDISLPQLTVLDLSDNLYEAYQMPDCFRNLTNLQVLSLGSKAALSVNLNDFKPMTDIPLEHLVLGAGVPWQKYESGALGVLSLQKLSLFTNFCGNLSLFDSLLEDLNLTEASALRVVTLFSDDCNVTDDPFENLRSMPYVRNLTIENTWINSSFMEIFLKNLWLSSIENLSFVNVTYNEDTPDGFQFHPLNHSISLRSITFDKVNHYQYKYPTLNTSFKYASNLNYVKFSRTGMNILPCKVLSVMPILETLDVSDNLLTDLGFWWPPCSNASVFPKLKHLLLNKNRFSSLSFISGQTHEMKQLESLDLSFNSIYLDVSCKWPAHLIELNLGNNNLGNKVFQYLSPHFQRIYLSKTGITAITQEDLSRFPKLTHLHLSANSIQVLPELLDAPNLISFYMDQNTISSLSRYVFAGFPKLQLLQAGNNPFVCSCDLHWFLKDFNKSLLLDWPLHYSCSTPKQLKGLPLSEYKTSVISCEIWLQTTVAFSVFLFVATTLGLLFYKLDGAWYTKMLWVWIRVKRRGKKRSHLLKNTSFSYHAFISYSHQDAKFVISKLVPSLESVGISLCVHERDFVPGEFIIDNIINCVESSYKTLFLLSKHFVQSEWCNYELFFAQHRAINIQEDSLVFILLEPIPTDCLPKKYLRLRTLLQQQTYLEWPKEERKQQVFWASLKSMLRTADKSVVLRGVAVDLADSATLLTNQT
ncbi:toll-like receptor 1 [Syngnathoides biaculeatus]|uniref:toll-like receptor 1 n=1 Tax=Syngnathoides biaculeatus TaxID=300417 RepID=UPI0027A90A83|nr:toll-like receptor 1 [Syngnathoides biaculeatus]WHT06287.1 toll like receptor 25 [Syngnathoides biaculeatus]